MAVESQSATSITLLAETDVAKNGKAAEDDGTERDGRTGRTTTKKAPFLRRLCPLNFAPFNAALALRNSGTDDDNATLTD